MSKKRQPETKPYNPVDEAFVRKTPSVLSTVPLDHPEALREEKRAPVRTQASRGAKFRLTRTARYLTTSEEYLDLQMLVTEVSRAAETQVAFGQLLRACNWLLLHAQDELLESIRAVAPLKRPRNDDPVALVDFEFQLAQVMSRAFQKSAPIK